MATSSASLDRSPRSNWVEEAGGLPGYVRKIARAIHEKRGIPLSEAIPFAIGRIKRWAAGGDGVGAATQAKAAAALAAWEALKAKSKTLREAAVDVPDGDELDVTDVELWAAEEGMTDDTLQEAAPVDPLDISVTLADHATEQIQAAAALLEAARKPALSNTKRREGESLTDWGKRLKHGDRRNAQRADAKTRSGGNAGYDEGKHPRARDGMWRQGAQGADVRVIQRRTGAKADGQYGAQTRQKVMDFQKRHGLKVDGVVGRQTIAALRGDHAPEAVAPGRATGADRKWLSGRARRHALQESTATDALAITVTIDDLGLTETATDPLALTLSDDGRLVESPSMKIHEESDLALVETVAGELRVMDLALLEAATEAAPVHFNADGTIDMVIIRPCNGRGEGMRIYEADVLSRDAHVFTGWPVFDNHESPQAKRARGNLPRPPSELAGEIRESWWDPTFVTPDDSRMGFDRGAVIGRFMLTEDMEKLVRRLPRAVKTSVNAAATGMHIGTRRGRRGMIVEGIANDPENSSVDLVTKAGAGGQVASLFRALAA